MYKLTCIALPHGDSSPERELKMSECIDDMAAYTKLTDHVMYRILASSKVELKKV